MKIIHCPRCGAALEANPVIEKIDMHRSTHMLITYSKEWVEHECEGEA